MRYAVQSQSHAKIKTFIESEQKIFEDKDVDISSTARGILVSELDQATDDKAMYRLCSNFHTTAALDKQIIKTMEQFTNHHEAKALLAVNENVRFPFNLFDYLQRVCPCILEHDIFVDALEKLLTTETAYNIKQMQIAARIKYPNISNELGIEFLVAFYQLPILNEKHRDYISETIDVPKPVATIITAYTSDSKNYEIKPATIDGQPCPTWKSLAINFDLESILKQDPVMPPITSTPLLETPIGQLAIFRDDSIRIQTDLYGEASITFQSNLPFAHTHCQQLANIFEVLANNKHPKIKYELAFYKKAGEIKKHTDSDIALLVAVKNSNQVTLLLKTARGMEYGLKALSHLRFIDVKDSLPFYFHAMNIKCLAAEAEHCYFSDNLQTTLEPLRRLARKPSMIRLPFMKTTPALIRQAADRIITLIDALSEKENGVKRKKVSMTDDRLTKIIQHVISTSPHKSILLADDTFLQAIRVFNLKLSFPMQRRQSAVDSSSKETKKINVKPRASS